MRHRIDLATFVTGISHPGSLCLGLWAASIITAAAQTSLAIANASFEDGAAVTGVPTGWSLPAGNVGALGIANGGTDGTKMLWIGPDVSIHQDLAHNYEFDNFLITTSLPVVNPYAWFRSDVGLTVDNSGKVTGWETQTASGADLSRVVGTPTTTMMRTGGRTVQVVRFDGNSSLWASSADFGTLSGDRTVVVRARLTGTGDGFLFDGSTKSGITRAQVRGGMWQVGVQASSFSNADPATVAMTPNVWQTHVFQYDESGSQTTCSHWVDGVLAGSNVVSTDSTLGGLIVGENGAAALGLQVEVAELQVFNQLLSSTDQNLVQQGITERWGDLVDLPLTYQSSTVVQTEETVASTGIHGVAALEILSLGSGPGDVLTSLSFNLNGTTDPSDIEEILLYTSNSANFSSQTATLLASSSATAGSFTINAPITSNTQYFWLAAKLAGTSDDNDLLDAEITGFTLSGNSSGTYIPTVTSPPERVTIQRSWFHSVTIRRQGDDGDNTYRIPGLATSNAGTLLAVFDIRYNDSRDLPGNIDVGLMRSTDGGYTWGPMQAIMDFDAGVANSSGNGVGDPSILVDRNTGRIWCAALWSFGNNAWNGSGPGLTETETGQFVLNYSDDDGLTWSEPVSITPQIKDPAWNLYFNGPGKGICTRDGTLIFPAQYRDSSGIPHANFIFSPDNGQTWKNSPPAYVNGSEWTSEAQIVELDNGDLLFSMRNYLSRKERLWNIFSWNHETQTIDDGAWGTAWYEQTDPICMASVEAYSSKTDGDPWSGILFANPDSTAREKMSIRLSLDQGRTWPYKRKIDDRPAAYSCMTMLADGDIGILYETGDSSAYETLTFARFPLAWIAGTRDTDGDGISDFEEMARRDPAKPLTDLRAAAPVSIIPFPRDLIWLPQDTDASRVAIELPSTSSVILDHAEALLTGTLTQAGAVIVPADGSETCTIRLITGPVIHPDGSDEVYSLETAADGVTITAPTDAGLLYGVQTLLQLVKTPGGPPMIAGCSIIDWPAFGVRGFMHDVGRNFQSIELLKKQIDAFARYKLNTFHWHLTENAAWRIESTLYPQLTDAANHWPTREPGQFYTKQEILDFVNYCAARHITVIPEIDIPGHSEAFREAMGVATMSDPLVVEVLVNIVNELCDLLPADLVPRIHFGTDEVRAAIETPHPDLIPSVVSTARNRGREVITWWGGLAPVDNAVINQVWAPYSPRAENPFIDSRDMYINHFDALDGPAISYFQQICRTPKETDQSLGGILCYWPDINIDDPEKGLSIAPVFSSMVTFSERIWRGASTNHLEYWAKLPPAGHPLLAEFAEFEQDLTVHRDKYFAGTLPFPYVRQTDVKWKIIGPFDHGGNLAQSFAPENEILPSYQHGGNTYTWTDAIGGTVHLKHFFGYPSYTTANSGTYYALTHIESDTERDVDFWFEFGTHSVSNRRNGGNPPLGKWNAYEAQVWVNSEAVAPPAWSNPGLLAANRDEIPFTNEGYFYREPTRARLKAGSNRILLRVPHGAYNGYPAHKWMFTCMPIDWDGTQARELDGIRFNTTLPTVPPTRTEKASANMAMRFKGNEIFNGSSYINGWTETNASAAIESLNGSDLNRRHVSGSESWIGGTTLSKDGGLTTWDAGNDGDWTVETRMRFNECSNGFAIWLGTGSRRIVVEVFADRTQALGGNGFVKSHNNQDGNYHVFRIAHDSGNGRYHVWRDGERLTPVQGAPYDGTAADNRVILGDYTSRSFGDNANVDIDYFSCDQTGDYLPVGADADGDGLPDAWEFLHFDDLVTADAQTDDDGDGTSNLQEFIADTNPGDRASLLRVEGPVATSENRWRISVPESSPNRIYTLQATEDLSAPDSWRNLPGQGPRAGNGGALDFEETTGASRIFFRVSVSSP